MRRFILLLLLAVLPLQTTWAGVAHCPRGEHHGEHAMASGAASHMDVGHQHGSAFNAHHDHQHGHHGTAGHSGGPVLDCSLFQFVAVAPLTTALQSLPRPNMAVVGTVLQGHKSHVPDGLDRPNWRFAV